MQRLNIFGPWEGKEFQFKKLGRFEYWKKFGFRLAHM
jgi:hypothetical protein